VNDAFGRPQSVVVLGGTSEIALAILRRLGADGCTTAVLAARDPARLARAAGEVKAAGVETVHEIELEATEVATAGQVVERCFAAVDGQVDLVLVAVGLLGDQESDEKDPAAAARVITVNFTWPAAAMTRAADLLRRQGQGRVMVLSTVAGVRVRRSNYLYGSAKAGLDAFGVGLAEACRGSGVTVQLVRPGFVHTKMTAGRPAAPFATGPEVVADAVVHGLTTKQPVIWVPPVLRVVFAVFRQLPQGLWRRLPG
jgi:decaprenylphospho-beta-D-erythro-pentofuranosid-2-ulose 2-reductase